jgi:C_GCAxxG_C_C family probable redox protein
MNRVEKTVDLHKNGGLNCSQAILTAFGESFGMDPETAKMLGRPLGGGIGHQALTCGYLTGAVLVLALALNNKDEGKSRKDLDKAIRVLFNRFKERYGGATTCKELLGADMTTEEGVKKILEEKLPAKHCFSEGGIGQQVAEILETLIGG